MTFPDVMYLLAALGAVALFVPPALERAVVAVRRLRRRCAAGRGHAPDEERGVRDA